MLQQILKDMYIDPEILEELSEDQKQVLFFKMREEQIRRWDVWEDKIKEEEKLNPVIKNQSAKNVRFYCDADLNLIIDYSTEADPDDVKKKQEEDVLRKAEQQAKKEGEQKRKELEEIEAKHRQELKQKKEMERLRREMEERKEEERRRAEEEAIILSMEANYRKEKEESERKLLEEKNRIKEAERKKEEEERRREEIKREKEEEDRLKRELQKKRREDELAEEESKRKEEIYQSMKIEQEEIRKHEEEESKLLEDEWKEREKKAKVADIQRKNSFTNSKKEIQRIRRLSKERSELQKLRSSDVRTNNEFMAIPEDIPTTSTTTAPTTMSTALNMTSTLTLPAKKAYSSIPAVSSSSKTRSLPLKRPPLPSRPDGSPLTISNPVRVTSTRDEVGMTNVKRELIKPSRPAPPPSLLRIQPNSTGTCDKGEEVATIKRDAKPKRPTRPKSRDEVITWYKEVEYVRLSGLDYEKKPMEWFHGVITRQESERLLTSKKQGSYLVRLSERVWGYTISFKDIGRCKHFLVDTAQGGYQFFGMEQIVHSSLSELVEYHKKKHISGLGEELLLYPCGQEKTPPDYEDLFTDKS